MLNPGFRWIPYSKLGIPSHGKMHPFVNIPETFILSPGGWLCPCPQPRALSHHERCTLVTELTFSGMGSA